MYQIAPLFLYFLRGTCSRTAPSMCAANIIFFPKEINHYFYSDFLPNIESRS